MKAFLLNVGRQKMVLPLYEAMQKDPQDKAWGDAVFKEARERYHPMTQKSVSKKIAGK